MAVTFTREFYINFGLFLFACLAVALSIWAFLKPCKNEKFGEDYNKENAKDDKSCVKPWQPCNSQKVCCTGNSCKEQNGQFLCQPSYQGICGSETYGWQTQTSCCDTLTGTSYKEGDHKGNNFEKFYYNTQKCGKPQCGGIYPNNLNCCSNGLSIGKCCNDKVVPYGLVCCDDFTIGEQCCDGTALPSSGYTCCHDKWMLDKGYTCCPGGICPTQRGCNC